MLKIGTGAATNQCYQQTMASSPTTVASTANISTLTEQMMMLEIDDIDETNCTPDSAVNHLVIDIDMMDNGSNYQQELC